MPRPHIHLICSIVLFNLKPYLNQFETTDVGSFLGNFTVNEKINKTTYVSTKDVLIS